MIPGMTDRHHGKHVSKDGLYGRESGMDGKLARPQQKSSSEDTDEELARPQERSRAGEEPIVEKPIMLLHYKKLL